MMQSEDVSGILFQAGLEKLDNSNSSLLRNFFSSQNTIREEMKFCMRGRFVVQIIPISKFRLVPSFETAH